MKTRILSILALLLMAVTGAWAQTYTVTFSGACMSSLNKAFNNVTMPYSFSEVNGLNLSPWNVIADEGTKYTNVYVSSGGEGKVSVSYNLVNMTITISGAFEGTATIHCEGDNEISRNVYVTCVENRNVTGITLSQTEAAMTVGGDALTLTATVAPDNAADKTVTWTTSDASVATVADGVVTAVGAGIATITATATNGTDDTSDDFSATCTVTVTESAAAIFAIDTDGTTQNFGSVEADATAQKTFTVTNNGNATLNVSFAATGDFTVTDPASSRKFYLTDNFGWSTGYAYAWDSKGKALLGEWPGTACGNTTNDYDETMFVVTVPSNAAGVIVNNGNGEQTVDITNFTQGYWMNGSKDGSGHYTVEGYEGGSEETPAVLTVAAGESETFTVTMNTATLGSKSGNITLSFDAKNATSFTIPCTGEVAAPTTYIVAGNNAEIFGIPWYGTYEANKMTKGGDGKYTKTYNVEDAFSDIQLKVVKDGEDWIGDETGNNVTFSMKQAGSFTVTLDPNANPVYVTVTGDNVVLANTEYAINYATGMQNGTVTGPDTAKEDDEVTLTITPAAGYVLESISVTGVTTENAVEVTDGKFTMPAEDVNVIATFKLVTYAITLAETDDNSTTLSENNGKLANVTLTRTLQTGGWNTFAAPFSTETPSGWTVKVLSSSAFDSSTGELTLTFDNASSIEAGKPYLVKVTANVENPTFNGVTISNTTTTTETEAVNFVPTLGKELVTGDGTNASDATSFFSLK